MTYATNQLFEDGTDQSYPARCTPTRISPKTFAANALTPSLARMTPVSYDESVDKWKVWTGLTDFEIASIAVDATGGTWRITIEGETTADIAFNATAAAVQAAIELLPGRDPGEIVVTGGPGVSGGGTPYVLTWGGQYQGRNAPPVTTVVTGTPPLLTGGAATAVVTTTAGVEKNGTDRIRGFVWESEAVTLDATNDVLINVATEGEFHYSDIVLPSGEVAASLKNELRKFSRPLGLNIIGLENVR